MGVVGRFLPSVESIGGNYFNFYSKMHTLSDISVYLLALSGRSCFRPMHSNRTVTCNKFHFAYWIMVIRVGQVHSETAYPKLQIAWIRTDPSVVLPKSLCCGDCLSPVLCPFLSRPLLLLITLLLLSPFASQVLCALDGCFPAMCPLQVKWAQGTQRDNVKDSSWQCIAWGINV